MVYIISSLSLRFPNCSWMGSSCVAATHGLPFLSGFGVKGVTSLSQCGEDCRIPKVGGLRPQCKRLKLSCLNG